MEWHNKLSHPEFEKNWDRSAPSFANINLLGKCNVDCYFCLGKDIDPILSKQNQLGVHFNEWENFDRFLDLCEDNNIKNLYITGQNTDSLIYRYLPELIDELQGQAFDVGLRTNGYLAHKRMDALAKCRRNVGLSIHTLNPDTNEKIMGRRDIPDWKNIIPNIPNVRVSIVLNRYNENEAFSLFHYIASFPNVKYVQVRRICTDSREEYLLPDVEAYERIAETVENATLSYGEFGITPMQMGDFYGAPVYEFYGKEFCFWRTVKTDIDSFNYFTDGTISEEYFVVEGYMKESQNYPKIGTIPIDAHGMGKEGFWRNSNEK
jgi:MoaA/NifB/PqqE/SkfB family radical SAM enzyme